MNHLIKILLLLAYTIAFVSCSDEYLNDKLPVSGVAKSAIIISPEWEAGDYQFTCEGVADADFTITSKPDWLILDSPSGKMTGSTATIHGYANADPLFSNTGIYVDQMVVTASGKQFAVPLYYITEGNPSVQVDSVFKMSYDRYYNRLQISNTGEGVLFWEVVSMPDWLIVDTTLFDPTSVILGKDATASVQFSLNLKAVGQKNLEGKVILHTNDKNKPLVGISVTADLGTPSILMYYDKIDFGISEPGKSVEIYNSGNGVLIWNFEGLPEWLTVSPASGVYSTFYSDRVTFTCDRSKLQPGFHSAFITLKSNASNRPSIPIVVTVRVPGLNPNVRPLEGIIVDVAFDKTTNTLFYVTTQPDKLIAYDVTAKTVLHEMALSNIPKCLAITEDFKQALVGHAGSVSKVDLSSFMVNKTYALDGTVFDLEWALDGWFCYTNTSTSSNTNLWWINSLTGQTAQTPQSPLYYSLGTAVLKKIPNQPYLIASREGVSPSGLFVFDLRTKALKSYTHESIDNVWFLNQAESMITGGSTILRTSTVLEATGNQVYSPASIGEIKISDFRNVAWWIDYCAASHSIWALISYYSHTYYPPVEGTIYQFDDQDYKLVKTYVFDNWYQPNPQVAGYKVEAYYVFSNSTGTELSVLRRGAISNTWSIEFIPIQ